MCNTWPRLGGRSVFRPRSSSHELELEFELELIQAHMAQKPAVLRWGDALLQGPATG